jgi:uncharacterized protein YbjT (DUF2867 family)
MNDHPLKVFVIGATGKTGLRLCAQLMSKGHAVYGLHRRSSDAYTLSALGVKPVLGDLLSLSPEELGCHMAGMDTVVFTAGAGAGAMELTELIDGKGVLNAATAAAESGVNRFILVSAFPDAWREKRMPPDFEHYMRVKRQADVHLASTALNWVILRPGTLVDSPGQRRVRAGLAIPYGQVSRDDVAATICSLVENDSVGRMIIELTEGDVPVAEAVGSLVVTLRASARFRGNHNEEGAQA